MAEIITKIHLINSIIDSNMSLELRMSLIDSDFIENHQLLVDSDGDDQEVIQD